MEVLTDTGNVKFPMDPAHTESQRHCLRHTHTLGMHAVHDKLSCTRLRNYTIVYKNMAAVTKFTAKSRKKKLHQPVE